MAGFISGFESDTPQSIRAMAQQLIDVGVDVPFLSILTPYRGTAAYEKMLGAGAIREDKGWEFYNGYNVAFTPTHMTPEQLLDAHRALWRDSFPSATPSSASSAPPAISDLVLFSCAVR